MTAKEYFELSCKTFPEMNFDKIRGWDKVDLIKKTAECLFLSGQGGVLADETRKQLRSLRNDGVIDFD